MTPSLALRPETPSDAAGVDALIDHAFGPGRFVKVSERVRELARFRPDLSICAFEDARLIGCARMWQVGAGNLDLAFLGPLAVEATARSGGIGAALVDAACQAAKTAGLPAVLLVGDHGYFSRLGFAAPPAAGLVLPGPVDQRRVLLRWLVEPPPPAPAGRLT